MHDESLIDLCIWCFAQGYNTAIDTLKECTISEEALKKGFTEVIKKKMETMKKD